MNRFGHFICLMAWVVLITGFIACTGQNGRTGYDNHENEGENQEASGQAVILFDTLFHDFGTIIEGEIVVSQLVD